MEKEKCVVIGENLIIDGKLIPVEVIDNERELNKSISYFMIIGKNTDKIVEGAVKTYRIKFNTYPQCITKRIIKDNVKIWLTVKWA